MNLDSDSIISNVLTDSTKASKEIPKKSITNSNLIKKKSSIQIVKKN